MDVDAASKHIASEAMVFIITLGSIGVMAKNQYNITHTFSPDGGVVIVEEAQSFGSIAAWLLPG